MTQTDQIGDFATAIRNAVLAGKDGIVYRHSKMIESIAKILEKEGFVEKVEIFTEPSKKGTIFKYLRIYLRYLDEVRSRPIIRSIKRVSKPGRRVYRGVKELKPVRGGAGIMIVSSSKGVISDIEARRKGVGGEVLLEVF